MALRTTIFAALALFAFQISAQYTYTTPSPNEYLIQEAINNLFSYRRYSSNIRQMDPILDLQYRFYEWTRDNNGINDIECFNASTPEIENFKENATQQLNELEDKSALASCIWKYFASFFPQYLPENSYEECQSSKNKDVCSKNKESIEKFVSALLGKGDSEDVKLYSEYIENIVEETQNLYYEINRQPYQTFDAIDRCIQRRKICF